MSNELKRNTQEVLSACKQLTSAIRDEAQRSGLSLSEFCKLLSSDDINVRIAEKSTELSITVNVIDTDQIAEELRRSTAFFIEHGRLPSSKVM